MNRRDFITSAGLGMLALSVGNKLRAEVPAEIKLSITIDDFSPPQNPLLGGEEQGQAILLALRKHSNLKAAGFVCGKFVDNDAGRKLVQAWDKQGHLVCNHSYSHLDYNSKTTVFYSFAADMEAGERVIKDFSNFRKIFRYPFLKEGDTADKRDLFRAYLKDQGYSIGHVTIGTADWYIDQRLCQRLNQDPKAKLDGYRDFYLGHIWDLVTYYDNLATSVLGAPVSHTMLLHFNLLNALFLNDALDLLVKKNCQLIDAETAFQDPVFARRPLTLPAGGSLIRALAKESGKFEEKLRYAGDDADYVKNQMDRLGL